ncbi:MAG TPA: hypothetical protein VIU40_04430 [Geobacteraceae bacterium]
MHRTKEAESMKQLCSIFIALVAMAGVAGAAVDVNVNVGIPVPAAPPAPRLVVGAAPPAPAQPKLKGDHGKHLGQHKEKKKDKHRKH